MKRTVFALMLILVINLTAADPIAVKSRLELFVDDYLLAELFQASRELQTPQPREMSLNFMEKQWEGSWSGQTPTVIKDGELYRMYYFACPIRKGPEEAGVFCYAESRDGITWSRPALNQVTYNGITDNNIIFLPDPPAASLASSPVQFHYAAPFIDTRPGIPASSKFKAMTMAYSYTDAAGDKWLSGNYLLVSADGLRWTLSSPDPMIPAEKWHTNNNYPHPVDRDGNQTIFWSDAEQAYVCLYRGWKQITPLHSPDDSYGNLGWYRWVKKITSTDLCSWSEPVYMDTGGMAIEHWYNHGTTPYFRAPHINIGMPSHYFIFHLAGYDDGFNNLPGDGHSARCESRLVCNRAGTNHYDRSFGHQRLIISGPPNQAFQFGPDQDDWPLFAGRPCLNAVPTGAKEMSIYLEQPGRIIRYSLRTDGYVALKSDTTGYAVTKPLTFDGDYLHINLLTNSEGSVKVELQDASGRPISGYTLAEATAMKGDEISKVVSWGARSDVGKLRGKTMRIKFQLYKAKVFSFRFANPS